MAHEAAHLRVVTELISANAGDTDDEELLATAQRSGAERGSPHPANTKGADPNECAVGKRNQRCERINRSGDHQSDLGWRARSIATGCISRPTSEIQRGGNRAEFGGELAGGSAVCTQARARWLRILPKANGRV